MDLQLAEAAPERDVLLDRDRLVADDEDLVVEPALAELVDLGVAGVGQVDARDLGAEGAGDRVELDAHWPSPFPHKSDTIGG